jgi:hypothetical protein
LYERAPGEKIGGGDIPEEAYVDEQEESDSDFSTEASHYGSDEDDAEEVMKAVGPQSLKNRKAGYKRFHEQLKRIKYDHQHEENMGDEELSDILPEDDGGSFRLIPDPQGNIVDDGNGWWNDEKTGERYQTNNDIQEGEVIRVGGKEVTAICGVTYKAKRSKDAIGGDGGDVESDEDGGSHANHDEDDG